MQQRTRQRLIGLLLLLLLAAIVAPLVLRSPEQVRVALDMSIPEPPAMDEPEVAPVIGEREQVATDEQISDEQRAVAEAGERALDDVPAYIRTPRQTSGRRPGHTCCLSHRAERRWGPAAHGR